MAYIETERGVKRKLPFEFDSPSILTNREVTLFKQSSTTILHLSDDILYLILQYLDTTSLYTVSRTCERFRNLVKRESLWINVDARQPPNTWAKNRFVWKNAHKNTKSILLKGEHCVDVLMHVDKLIVSKVYSNLTVLALEHQCIKYCKLCDFPNTLQEFSLRWSFIPRHQDFFRFSFEAMVRLKTLILDHCKWLEGGCFMSLCRFPSLEILSCYMCTKIGDDDISSLSIASKLGFRNLKVVDLRFTGLGDLFVRTFYSSASLQVIYLQNFPATYYMERWQRKIDILNGAKKFEHTYISDDEDNNNLSRKSLQNRFNITEFHSYDTQSVTNSTIAYFNRLYPSRTVKPRPSSVLYKYPYGECTCGFNYKASNPPSCESNVVLDESNSESDNSDDDPPDFECTDTPNCWDMVCLQRKLKKESKRQHNNRSKRSGSNRCYYTQPPTHTCCNMVMDDSCVSPDWCQEEATPDHIVYNWMNKREPRTKFEMDLMTYADKNFRAANHLRCLNCNCEENVIVIRTDNDGDLGEVRVLSSNNPLTRPQVKDQALNDTIDRMVDLIRWIRRYNYDADPERILRGFTKCLDIGDLLAPADDRTAFVAEIASFLIELAKHKQDIYHVISYHVYCLKDLMIQMLMAQTDAAKKRILLRYFRNVVHTERIGNDNSRVRCCGPTKRIKDFIPTPLKRFKNCNFVPNVLYQPIPVIMDNDGTNIMELSFRGHYHINDRALQALKDLNLKLLDITGTNVTKEGIGNFLEANPSCRVIHESACICRPNLHF